MSDSRDGENAAGTVSHPAPAAAATLTRRRLFSLLAVTAVPTAVAAAMPAAVAPKVVWYHVPPDFVDSKIRSTRLTFHIAAIEDDGVRTFVERHREALALLDSSMLARAAPAQVKLALDMLEVRRLRKLLDDGEARLTALEREHEAKYGGNPWNRMESVDEFRPIYFELEDIQDQLEELERSI